jgi:uncharacterized protein
LIQIKVFHSEMAHGRTMIGSVSWLGALCASEVGLRGGLLLGLFVAGATGSVMHCAPMCGGFVLGQVSERLARLPPERLCEARRISSGLLLPYHLGRLTTYAMLGAVTAGSAAVLGRLAWFGPLSAGLLVLAAVLFLTHALRRIAPSGARFMAWLDRGPRRWGQLLARLTRRIPRGSGPGEFLLGVTLGFLPCGFLYAALAAAAASARPAVGAAAMLAFGLGTAPALMLVGIAGHAAGRRWHRCVAAAAPALLAFNAVILLVLAWQRIS